MDILYELPAEDFFPFEVPVLQKSLSELSYTGPELQRNISEDPYQAPIELPKAEFHELMELPFANESYLEPESPTTPSISAASLLHSLQKSPFFSVESFDPYYITCSICLSKQHDYYSLCETHQSCSSCITLLLQNYIDSFLVFPSDLICPHCSIELSAAVVNKFTSYEYSEKLINTRFKINGQRLAAEGKAIPCPVPDCPGFGHVLPGEKITACSKCKCTLCCDCKKGAHPGISCEEAALVDKDETLEDLIFSQNWKKCPTCGVPVEKLDGCNFVTCSSSLCRGRNSLCYLCGRFVVEDQHFDHFRTDGPFGITCNTLDGIPEDIDPSLLVPQVGEVDENERGHEEEEEE